MKIIKRHAFSILFLTLGFLGFFISGLPPTLILSDLIERFSRNLVLVLSLVLPLLCGLGINFALVLGAMAGQTALLLTLSLQASGIGGVLLAMGIATPLAAGFGLLTGYAYNRCKGQEMILGLTIGFFASGFYQIFCLVLPVQNSTIGLAEGIGVKASIDLGEIKYALDQFPFTFSWGIIRIPMGTLCLSLMLCGIVWYFLKTRMGRQIVLTGENIGVAGSMGIHTNRIRVFCIMASMVLAAWGQIISLQNIGTLNTFSAQDQASIYAAAALFAGGATLKGAKIRNVIFGTILFYFFFLVVPMAGNVLFQDAQTGEYFRVLLSYGVLAAAFLQSAEQKEF